MKTALLGVVVLVGGWASLTRAEDDLTRYVDPMIGTAEHGHTFPGPCVPYGMIQLSPDNGRSGWDWCSGYHYSEDKIAGFSHTHLSGTGCGDLTDLSVMPTTKKLDAAAFKAGAPVATALQSKFSHSDERAEAGYYRVLLADDRINVELTASTRGGYHRYTYPAGADRQVAIDLGFRLNGDQPTETMITKSAADTLVGYRFSKGWAPQQKVFFVVQFSEPISDLKTHLATNEGGAAKGKEVKAVASFAKNDKPLLARVAISSASLEGAKANLAAEKYGFDFDQVRCDARAAWNRELGRIVVTTPNEDLKKVFYTAAYHAYVAPCTFSDVDGGYKGYKHKPMRAQGYTKYTVLSLWDTFRSLMPLMALVNPSLTNDVVKSMLDQYQETGQLPIWELVGNETHCMIGYHSAPVISEAIVKGIGDFDRNLALEAMKAAANSDTRGLKFYRELGYVPYDKEPESVSKTLEYAYDDWCIAQAAKVLGRTEDHQQFLARSQNYKNLFDPQSGFMRPKAADGKWLDPFNPKFSGGKPRHYTEGNSWQWTWSVQHDPAGLVKLFGGPEKFAERLDRLFVESPEQVGEDAPVDISGLIGQYAHGNEPCHHVVYLYNFAGQPAKTQQRVSEIAASLYTSKVGGLCGNDDCGQMSAWYLFSTIGIYPLNPVDGRYYFGCPRFEKVKLTLGGGKSFTVSAENVDEVNNCRIQLVLLNGKPLDRNYVTYQQIAAGGELHFVMGPK